MRAKRLVSSCKAAQRSLILLTGLLALVSGACIGFDTSQCANGVTCPAGTLCHGDGCVPADQLISCLGKDNAEPCSYATVPIGVCSDGLCVPTGCGNGAIEADETCDEGDVLPGDGCSEICQIEICGNGIVDRRQLGAALIPEECDDGNLLSLDACSSDCARATGIWEELQSNPGERSQHAMAYDAARQRIVLVGSLLQEMPPETWEWDGSVWRNLTPIAPQPSPKPQGSMVYDAAREQLIYVGGYDFFLGELNETWAWNGTRWSNITPADPSKSLPPIVHAPIAYDSARERVVVFTGETWEWDGASWSNVSPANSPPAAGPLAYDASRGVTVLVVSNSVAETWEWDGTTWTKMPVAPGTGPEPYDWASISYDALRKRVVRFTNSWDPIWEWDGAAWSHVAPSAPEDSPPARLYQAMAYDLKQERTVLYGGEGNEPLSGPLLNTWEWDGSRWRNATITRSSPESRELHSLDYDPSRAELILFGGSTAGGSVNDTWSWDGARWTDRSPAGASPSPRNSHGSAYAIASERLVIFGGADETTLVYGDTWAWDGSAWTDVTPPMAADSPPARVGGAMVYDAARDQVLLFGGQATLPGPVGPFDLIEPLGDTWVWNGSTWAELLPPASPSARTRASIAYDAARQRVVLHGGQVIIDPMGDAMGDPVMGERDTWEWDGTTWLDVTPTEGQVAPVVQAQHVMTYDAALQRIVLTGTSEIGGFTLDTWQWQGSKWTRVPPEELPALPGPRGRHAMAYDARAGRVVLFGGNSFAPSDSLLDDTWLFSYRAVGPEACYSGLDGDRDDLVGCDDPDCWGSCTPLCPPGTTCDADAPQCGDGVCNANLETPRLCPADCRAPPPVCGDFICDVDEDAAACPGDC